jgi:vancomycin resistance protein VanJ
LLPLGGAAAVVLGPVMGLRVHFSDATADPAWGRLRVLTCNLHHRAADPLAMARLILDRRPDVVLLQEASPLELLHLLPDWRWHYRGNDEQFIASRYPIRGGGDVTCGGTVGFAARYEVEAPWGVVPVYDVHLQSPHTPLRLLLQGEDSGPDRVWANLVARDEQSRAVASAARAEGGAVIVAGDFNMTDDSAIYRRWWGEFENAFNSRGLGFGYTYRVRWTATRIDHVLSGSMWSCRSCEVLQNVGSPHRPLLAQLEWRGPRERVPLLKRPTTLP